MISLSLMMRLISSMTRELTHTRRDRDQYTDIHGRLNSVSYSLS